MNSPLIMATDKELEEAEKEYQKGVAADKKDQEEQRRDQD